MTSDILNFADSLQTQNAKYLEKEALFSIQISKFIHCIFKAVL